MEICQLSERTPQAGVFKLVGSDIDEPTLLMGRGGKRLNVKGVELVMNVFCGQGCSSLRDEVSCYLRREKLTWQWMETTSCFVAQVAGAWTTTYQGSSKSPEVNGQDRIIFRPLRSQSRRLGGD